MSLWAKTATMYNSLFVLFSGPWVCLRMFKVKFFFSQWTNHPVRWECFGMFWHSSFWEPHLIPSMLVVFCLLNVQPYGGFPKSGYPQSSSILVGLPTINIYKPTIWGYPHLWKPPYLWRMIPTIYFLKRIEARKQVVPFFDYLRFYGKLKISRVSEDCMAPPLSNALRSEDHVQKHVKSPMLGPIARFLGPKMLIHPT